MKNGFVLILVAFSFSLSAQDDKELTIRTVTKADIKGHMYFLASNELKGRATGSPEIAIAAKYLATSFQRYGVKPVPGAEDGYFQPLNYTSRSYPDKVDVTLDNQSISSDEMLVLAGSNIQTDADMTYLYDNTKETFDKSDLNDKIVMYSVPVTANLFELFTAGRERADWTEKAGAHGMIQMVHMNVADWERVSGHFRGDQMNDTKEEDSFFQILINDPNDSLLPMIRNKKRKTISVEIGNRTSVAVPMKNVVGMVEGSDPELKNEYVIYSAHYDHLGIGKANAEGDSIYNGARDNAVGVVTVMSAAENIAKYPTKRSALFILFAGEEKGLLGSRWYADHPLIPLDQMVYCFNSDNGGYNDTSLATIIGLGRTTEEENIKKACSTFGLKAIDDPAKEEGLFDRSDNVSFAAKGIPAPTFSLGFTSFDSEINKYYHQTADNPESLDYNYLENFFRAYVLSCRLIANDPKRPFWLEGDKYFDAGKSLYGK